MKKKTIKYHLTYLAIFFFSHIPTFAYQFFIPNAHVGSNKQNITTERKSSFPFLSGDTFRNFCDHIIDVDQGFFNTTKVKKGDTIFVYPYLLEFFFSKVHPKIDAPYILVSHDTDIEIPGKFLSHLDDDNLIAWFGKNCRKALHTKLYGLPIGLANAYWPHGDTSIVRAIKNKHLPKKHLLYVNFVIKTNKEERTLAYNYFRDNPLCYTQDSLPFDLYLTDLAESQFVLSPRGNGEDAHRTWEALIMGAIPIVKSSFLDYLFKDLPVIIVDDWSKVTNNFLEKKYSELIKKEHNAAKLYAPFWINQIKQLQSCYRIK